MVWSWIGLLSGGGIFNSLAAVYLSDVDLVVIDQAPISLIGLSDRDLVDLGLVHPAASWNLVTACGFGGLGD